MTSGKYEPMQRSKNVGVLQYTEQSLQFKSVVSILIFQTEAVVSASGHFQLLVAYVWILLAVVTGGTGEGRAAGASAVRVESPVIIALLSRAAFHGSTWVCKHARERS